MEPIPEDFGGLLPRDTLTQEERQILLGEQQTATTSRTTDTLIRWYITPAMIAANITLLLFAIPRLLNGEPVALSISGISLALVYLWYQLEMRIYGLVEYWNDKLIAIEEWLQPRERVYGGEDWERDVRGVKWTTHDILLLVIRIVAISETVTIVLFVIATVKPDLFPPVPTPSAIERRLEQVEQKIGTIESVEQSIGQLDKRMEKTEEAVRALKPPPKPAPQKPKKGARR